MGRYSLSLDALKPMAMRIALVIMLTTAASYFVHFRATEKQVRETLARYIQERGGRERQIFDQASANHQLLIERFHEHLTRWRSTPSKSLAQFDLLVKQSPDGAYRNRDPHFDGRTQTGVFIGGNARLDDDLRQRILAAHDTTEEMGYALRTNFQDTYFTFQENAIVLYWPDAPRWAQDAKADLDLTAEEYVYVADRKHNPQRKTAWTGLFYDKVSKIWMATAATPLDEKERHIASVHHDVMVNEIFLRTINDHLEGTYNMIVRSDGRLIAHPKFMDQIRDKAGTFDINRDGDTELKTQFQALVTGGKDPVKETDDQLLAAAYLESPGWYVVTVYPKSLIHSKAISDAIFLFAAGVFSLIFELLILFVTLRKKITEPLRDFIRTTKEIAQGRFHAKIPANNRNELGELAESFGQMVTAIQDRDRKLEAHNRDLERLVEERTEQLDEQKAINMQASKMSALGEMAGGVAHEINTPLAAIKLSATLAQTELKDVMPDLDQIVQHLQLIEQTSDRVAKIVKGLRSFARDGSRDPMQFESLKTIVDEVLSLCAERFKSHGVTLEVSPISTDVVLECRSTEICQVLLNLLNNSYDAITDKTEKWIRLDIAVIETDIEIRVTDCGTGISEDIQQKIFNPFFTTKDIGKGTGLGLSISGGLVKNYQGRLFYELKNGHTSFVIRLPLRQKPDAVA